MTAFSFCMNMQIVKPKLQTIPKPFKKTHYQATASFIYSTVGPACLLVPIRKKNTHKHKQADLGSHSICSMTPHPLFYHCIHLDKYYPRITAVLQAVFTH